MIAFADSSALVTAYAPAEAEVLPADAHLVVSALARVEVVSALWRKAALGEVSAEIAGRMVRTFESQWHGTHPRRRFAPVVVDERVLEQGAALTGSHGLRSLDALQLASALVARRAEPACRTVIALDERLRRAAAAEGFALLPLG